LRTAFICLVATAVTGCFFATTDGGPNISAGIPVSPANAELGKACTAACGSGDDRKCALQAEQCSNRLCLVDPAAPAGLVAYCSIDCATSDCPNAYHCEDIVSFSDRSVTRACVANAATCDNGIIELGEVCDGDGDGSKGTCVDCKKWSAPAGPSKCGDGIVQVGEECDGDTATAYCSPKCERLEPAFGLVKLTFYAKVEGDAAGRTIDYSGTVEATLPQAGDANGCNAVKVIVNEKLSTRFTWTYCDPKGTRATVTMALPRSSFSYPAAVPQEFVPTIQIENPRKGTVAKFATNTATRSQMTSTYIEATHQSIGAFAFEYSTLPSGSSHYNSATFIAENFIWNAPVLK
jgi:cysteine-rich repeat protein